MKKFKEYTNNIGGVAQAYGTTIPTGDLRTEPLNASKQDEKYLKQLNKALEDDLGKLYKSYFSNKPKDTVQKINMVRKKMGQKPLTISK
tara:strand:+ start:1675 stop:1941 length:267 start_codon:yes stop_codon:yes gene_type:complete